MKKYTPIRIINKRLPIIFLISLFTIAFIFQSFDETAKDMIIVKILIFLLIFSVIYFIVFMIWAREIKSGKKFENFRRKEEKIKLDDQIIDELNGIDYYSQIPKYEGEKTFGINKGFWRLFFSIVFPVLAVVYTVGLIFKSKYNLSDDWMFWQGTILSWICLIIYNVQFGFKKVIITQNGVKFKKLNSEQFIPWKKIKTIGISVNPYGKATSLGYIYFSKKEIKNSIAIQQHYENVNTIVLKDRPKVIHCILQYWDKEIVNLNRNKGWKNYIERLFR